ncbi:Na+/H+ antiporter subunit E [Nesterenkonia sandarakina]|uniref:Multicomponent Na+:H+ antiporter subunit E n=1 Tax=Nesterenkonia sandarakina TaxID=272918 RepID=A0A7Z0EBZ6_9MICC|nr:multicomponent Na+:H+ antiporter subunit E [Nesterenkonia sandarakina]
MKRRLTQLLRLPGFLVYFLVQMFRANWQVAVDILTPGSALTPGVVAYPARSRSAWELTLLSNLITLTPGTLTIDVETNNGQHVLYVLGLYAPSDPNRFRQQLEELEGRMRLVTVGVSRDEGRHQ